MVLWLPNLMVAAGIISLPQAAAFLVSRRTKESDRITSSGFWLALGLGLFEAMMLYPFIPALLGPKGTYLIDISRIFLFYLPVAYCGLTLLGVDQGLQKFTRFNILRVLPPVIYVVALTVLALTGHTNVTTVLGISLLAQVLASAIRIGIAGRRLSICDWPDFLLTGKKLVRQGAVFSMPALSGIILMRADLAILIHTVSAEQIGYYSAAMAIAMGQTGLSSSLVQVNFPRLSSVSEVQAKRILRSQLKRAIIPILSLGLLVALLAKFIVRYLFGFNFMPALPMTYILIAAILLWGISQVLENGLRGMGYGLPGAFANAIGIIILVLASLPLVQSLGGKGMAIAMALSQLMVVITLIIWMRHLPSSKKKALQSSEINNKNTV